MAAIGKLVCSFPGPAITFPAQLFDGVHFRRELASFLTHMDRDYLEDNLPGNNQVPHPRYITQLLTDIINGLAQARPAQIRRFTKRISDDVLSNGRNQPPWRRSPVWLVLRVALQSSLYQGDHRRYKSFMAFLMARIIEKCITANLDIVRLVCMACKVSHRSVKLGNSAPDFVVARVTEAVKHVRRLLERKFENIRSIQGRTENWDPGRLNIAADTTMSLPQLLPYIRQILQYANQASAHSSFTPTHAVRLLNERLFNFTRNRLTLAFQMDTRVALADFEFCVEMYLPPWLRGAINDESASSTLSICIEEYAKAAMVAYASNPEDESIMILTLMTLWVAMDQVAVAQCPLLRDYSPEIPVDLFQPLLLRRQWSIKRLLNIQHYLRERHASARNNRSVFDGDIGPDSFAVKYYDSPDGSQYPGLRARIERDADRERTRVQGLWRTNTDLHRQLQNQAEALQHTQVMRPIGRGRNRREYHLDRRCPRCQADTVANSMKTEVHEWPLPTQALMEKVVLFELVPPPVFVHWRSTTYTILYDVCLPHSCHRSEGVRPPITLAQYVPLQRYVDGMLGRVALASTVPPLTKYGGSRSLPCNEADVCQPNALVYRLHDSLRDIWVQDSFKQCSIRDMCTLRLTPGSVYDNLEYAVRGTSHTPNEVVANQADCAPGLALHEYEAFATLRAGPRLQWLNILREVRSRVLTFGCEPVHTLLIQSAWQIGVVTENNSLDWHEDLQSPDFCDVLLRELDDLLGSVEANWLESTTVRTVVLLAGRVLASGILPPGDILDAAYRLLRRARDITFSWMHQLVDRLQRAEEEDTIRDLQRLVFESAATCRCTYDVDTDHFQFLLATRNDIAILIECSIMIYDNSPPQLDTMSPDFIRLCRRDERFASLMQIHLSDVFMRDCRGLNDAISSIWPGYRPSGRWTAIQQPGELWKYQRWMTTTTIADEGQQAQEVHLNLLTGSLLINGKPLGRLPRNITAHPLYTRTFGSKILDVVPADMPGTEFASRTLISGWQVFLGIDGPRLVIRAKKEDQVLELIPHAKFSGDLPKPFVEDYVHWLDVSTLEIEFRPRSSLWKSSPANWRLTSLRSRPVMTNPSQRMVDIHSSTFSMVLSQLKALEILDFIIITTPSDSPNQLHIDLPRFQLSFFMNADRALECQNFPEMIVDPDQSAETLLGLRNYLILRFKDDHEFPRCRRILIPYGEVHCEQHEDHVSITIDRGTSRRVTYHEYMIDNDMRCLVSQTSLTGKLYQVYLHALTSYYLPDPLTLLTGTEEALRELQSAACFSFQSPQKEDLVLLKKIQALTPQRAWCFQRKNMQHIYWKSNLSPLAQHHAFSTLVDSIMEHIQAMDVFGTKIDQDVSHNDPEIDHLSRRAAFRLAAFYPEEYGFAPSQETCDVVYQSRDLERHEDNVAADVTRMVFTGPSTLHPPPILREKLSEWGTIGPSDNGLEFSFSYSRQWLDASHLRRNWIPFLYYLSSNRADPTFINKCRWQLMFSLPALAYCAIDVRTMIPSLLASVMNQNAQVLQITQPWAQAASSMALDFSDGTMPQETRMGAIISEAAHLLHNSPVWTLGQRNQEQYEVFVTRRLLAYQNLRRTQGDSLRQLLLATWPCDDPILEARRAAEYTMFDVRSVLAHMKSYFKTCYNNRLVSSFTDMVQNDISAVLRIGVTENVARYTFVPCSQGHESKSSTISLSHVFATRNMPAAGNITRTFKSVEVPETWCFPPDTANLRLLIEEFQESPDTCKRLYARDLERSRQSLRSQSSTVLPPSDIVWTIDQAKDYRNDCRQSMDTTLANIQRSLNRCSSRNERALQLAGLWPRLTPRAILRRLLHGNGNPSGIMEKYAYSYLEYQRSQRLLRAVVRENHTEFYREGFNNKVTAYRYPEWILLQLENNLICRKIQTEVADAIISPPSGQNSVLQLNMGEGKSSVIVPMAAVALAKGDAIVRVVVLKPLANQMFQMLVERLSGLLNRRIFYMPFSRQLDVGPERIRLIRSIYTRCMEAGGILVAQPEHMLSFKLMGIDRLIHASMNPGEGQFSRDLLNLQKWVTEHSRDILDESDEILHCRYQLIYTVGQQRSLEGYPDRWTTIQQIFGLVVSCADSIQQMHPLGVEVRPQSGCFPFFRILRREAGDALVEAVCQKILSGHLENYPFFSRLPIGVVHDFITNVHVAADDARAIEVQCSESNTWSLLLILRGLFAHGILIYILSSRRWRVDYGLDLSRSLLAVPYRAKDVPSLLAEFGHPDVAISLTCLSYYYSGLTENQLDACFQLLYKQDDPFSEYESWIKTDNSVPAPLHHLSGVNTKDKEQYSNYLIPLFQRNHAVVDFYLSHVVFPKQAKEFPWKLSTSGWDLAEGRAQVTTGFSGTNDNRYLLPTSIRQRDRPDQQSTNAKVLAYLLRSENNYYKCARNPHNGNSLTAQEFLDLLVQERPEIEVLLDVGAQMLELRNEQLVRYWLSLCPNFLGAVYFSDSDELMVLNRRGNVEPLLLSPLKYQLDRCLVYLDQAHTRGTDLKLPLNFRAAITLGSKVTKDRLVQGAMRMRQLGQGQSVMFFAPLEIDRKIRGVAGKSEEDVLKTIDVLRWVMTETCDDIMHHVPHWAQQGLDYFRRRDAWTNFTASGSTAYELLIPWVQPEGRSLKDLYAVTEGSAALNAIVMGTPELRDRCQQLGVNFVPNNNIDEEQEREVNQEIEREQQIERPAKRKPAVHVLRNDVRHFIETGVILPRSPAIASLFQSLSNRPFGTTVWSPKLLCTNDFAKTVLEETVAGQATDNSSSHFLRSVNWILSYTAGNVPRLVVLSPFEVNELLPVIRRSRCVRLHVYAPRVTSTTKPFDDLQFHYFPRTLALGGPFTQVDHTLTTQLNIFAGQLYLTDYAAYRALCLFLGLHLPGETDGLPYQSDGFISQRDRSRDGRVDLSPFTRSPVPFLKDLVALRRKGNTYTSTHVGKLLHGHSLTLESFS